MPNPWTGRGNPYTREEVIERLHATCRRGEPIIAAGAGTGISAKFIEKGGADLIIIYNSGRFRMSGHGSTCGLMAYGDANAVAMEIGEFEVLPVVEEVPVICGVHATDPRRRMWHWLLKVKEMGFSGVNNFPTHCIVDGQFRQVLEETGMSVRKEFEMVALARKMDLFTIVYVFVPRTKRERWPRPARTPSSRMWEPPSAAASGSPAPRSPWTTRCAVPRPSSMPRGRSAGTLFFLSHGGPICAPADAAYINEHTDAVGFVGASSLERMGVEQSLVDITRRFKAIPAPAARKQAG